MTFDPARPRYTLPLAGKEYELLGTFELIEAAEHALKDGILSIAARVIDLPAGDTARLLAAILSASGHKVTPQEAGQTLFDLGLTGEDYAALKLHLYAFLRVVLAPPADREGTAKRMGEMIGKPGEGKPASRGRSTRSSASAS